MQKNGIISASVRLKSKEWTVQPWCASVKENSCILMIEHTIALVIPLASFFRTKQNTERFTSAEASYVWYSGYISEPYFYKCWNLVVCDVHWKDDKAHLWPLHHRDNRTTSSIFITGKGFLGHKNENKNLCSNNLLFSYHALPWKL